MLLWSLLPKADKNAFENVSRGEPYDVFTRNELYIANVERIDGTTQLMAFSPIPTPESPKLLSFEDVISTQEQSRTEKLMMAIALSVGAIFLSPTPWYCLDSIRLQQKVYFFGRDRVMFVTGPSPLERFMQGDINRPKASSVLFELGTALIEIGLHRQILREVRDSTRLNDDEEGIWNIPRKRPNEDARLNEERWLEDIAKSGLVAMEMGVEYQNIVNTCFARKYETESGVVQIDESSAMFRINANEGIVVPLRKLWQESERKSRSQPDERTPAGPSREPKLAGRAEVSHSRTARRKSILEAERDKLAEDQKRSESHKVATSSV